jgi:hypothetical protein
MNHLYAGFIASLVLLLIIAAPVSAAARVEHIVEKQPFNLTFPIYLCDETVLVEGVEHDLLTSTCSSAGVCSFRMTRTIKGTGVGESTGIDYQFLLKDARNVVRNPAEQYKSSVRRTIQLIGQGSAENHRLHCVFQRIINANGETATVITECHSMACEDGGLIG